MQKSIQYGVLANIAESYFLAHSFLVLLAPTIALIGMGYLLIFFTIIANLGFFYAMGASSITKIMHLTLRLLKLKLTTSVKRYYHLRIWLIARLKEICRE